MDAFRQWSATFVEGTSEWMDRTRAQTRQYTTFSNHGVKPVLPPRSFFKFPPSNFPSTLPPPTETINYEPLFHIPPEWYNALLSPAVPVTFALVYATVITYLNAVNQRRNRKPWAISQALPFKLFVITHNIFLSLYSLWTFLGMVNALRVSVASPYEHGIAATVDSLCKMHGPRGYGAAVTFNESRSVWSFTDRMYHLAEDGFNPDSTDVGRIWNEGLAFYGWLFYVSKFYEVVDTLVILAKGKKSSFLQTYHHAGAMLSMWAGIRYMSPPIWMFVTVNSFIHFVMYAFYTSTTIGYRVPKGLKQILTTLQITQFVVGVIYAFAHYFVAYQIPVSVPYVFHLGDAIRQAATPIKSDASSAVSVATATASADVRSWLKKLMLRAAGREGLAGNVENQFGQTFGVDAASAVRDLVQREATRYRQELQWVHCLDTSGQTFAIYLNVFYLAPLTWLFIQFFIKSYLQRAEERRRSSVAHIASQSLRDARKGVSRRLSEVFEDYQGANGEADVEETRKELRKMAKDSKEGVKNAAEAVSDQVSDTSVQDITKAVEEGVEQVKDYAQATAEKAQDNIQQAMSDENKEAVKAKVGDAVGSAKKSVENLMTEESTSNAADTAEKVKEEAEELGTNAVSRVDAGTDEVKDEVADGGEAAKEKADESTDAVKADADRVKAEAEGQEEKVVQTGGKKTSEAEELRTTDEHSPSEGEPPTNQPDDGSTVQEGKSFADAAAEGVPEETMGEHRVADEGTEDVAVKQEDDEDAESDPEPGSMEDQISDAMSSDIANSPFSLSRESSIVEPIPISPVSTSSKKKKPWHTRRRG